MYEKAFRLEKSPFGMTPDPSCLMMTPVHREALAGLLYSISKRKGFIVLTGDAGTGKTTLLRSLMRSAKSAQFSIILNPTMSKDELLEAVLMDFGVEDIPASKAQRLARLEAKLADFSSRKERPVLIIDEAHKLSPELLEEVRLLTNFETSQDKLLHIILAGQSELKELLNREDLRQLKQRIEMRFDLRPLSLADTGNYMQHRWQHAGGSLPIPFTHDAIGLIARASRGIPRLVNTICENALLLAYGSNTKQIRAEEIRQVLLDLDIRMEGDDKPQGDEKPKAAEKAPEKATDKSTNGNRQAAPTKPALLTSIPTIERYLPTRTPSWVGRLKAGLSFMRPMKVGNE